MKNKKFDEKIDKIIVNNITKVYKMYNTPMDKLKEAFSANGKVRHSEFYALHDLSFEVKKGEILGIVGRNGAGKSTLLKLITGILEPSKGSISVEGRISSLLELGTGFNMEYTGIDNIYFYGTLMGMTKEQMDERIDEIISFAEIGDYVHQTVKTYSSGMFARLAFSCAINVEPDILIVDEILSVGDMRFQAKCFNKFAEFQENGVTILYVGHDVGMMRSFCNRVMWLNNGKLVDIGDPTFVCAKYTEFMYLDDISEFTSYKKYEGDRKEGATIDEPRVNTEPEIGKIVHDDSKFQGSLAHWGTHVGTINSVKMVNQDNNESNHFLSEEIIKIEICFSDNDEFDYSCLSVAISIKNKEGIDLIVKTTYDEEAFFTRKKEHKITFELCTKLAKGDYYLVVALENRENASITYYEYIEGVKYFKIYTNKKIFGIVDADVKMKLD